MSVVGILAGFLAPGREIHRPGLLVNSLDGVGNELTGIDLVFQRAVDVVEIIVAPPVPLRPPEKLLAVVDEARRSGLDVGVQALLDQGLDLAGHGIGHADVQPLLVTAQSGEVDLVGSIREPGLCRAIYGRLSELGRPAGCPSRQIQILVLESVSFDLHPLLGVPVKDEQFPLIIVGLAGHGIAIGVERRPGIGQRD